MRDLSVIYSQQPQEALGPNVLWKSWDVGQFEGHTIDGILTLKRVDKTATLIDWNLRTGKPRRIYKMPFDANEHLNISNRGLIYGRFYLCESESDQLMYIDLETGHSRHWDCSKFNYAVGLGMSPDGEYLALCHDDCDIRIETKIGKAVHKINTKHEIVIADFTADSRYFYYCVDHELGYMLHVWDLANRKAVDTIRHVWGLPVESPDGKFLVVPVIDPPPNSKEEYERIVKWEYSPDDKYSCGYLEFRRLRQGQENAEQSKPLAENVSLT